MSYVSDAVISTASLSDSDKFTTSDLGADYFATEIHYRSLAGRIITTLQSSGRFILVTGDPPASPHLLSQALGKSTVSSHSVIDIRCGPELTREEVSRAVSVVAPAANHAAPGSETLEPAAPFIVFDDVDRLSDRQIEEICAAAQNGDHAGALGVLFARPGFLSRLERPELHILKDMLVGQVRFLDVGPDEGIDFLRYQLGSRDRGARARRLPRNLLLALAVVSVLVTASIAVFLELRPAEPVDDRSPHSAIANLPTPEASTAQPTPNKMTSAPPTAATIEPGQNRQATPHGALPPSVGGVHEPEATPPPSAAAQPVQVPQAEAPGAPPPAAPAPEATPPPAAPAQAPRAPPRQSTPPAASLSSPGSAAAERWSPADIAALVARGDGFLSAGDIASARLFYERAADAGDGAAALRLGATFDPDFLGRAGVRGIRGDPDQAASWYRRARALGNAAAADRLKGLDQRHPAEPGTPAR